MKTERKRYDASANPRIRQPCARCRKKKALDQFGIRKSGFYNSVCTPCRTEAGINAGGNAANASKEFRLARDHRTRAVIEAWCGMGWRAWATPEGRQWQRERGVNLHELWSAFMRDVRDREFARAEDASHVGDPRILDETLLGEMLEATVVRMATEAHAAALRSPTVDPSNIMAA